MPNYTQDYCPIAMTTSLGKDKLLLESFSGSEALSRPYQFELQFLAPPPDSVIAFNGLLGQGVGVRLGYDNNLPRYIHGIVSRLSEVERLSYSGGVFTRYRASLVPKLWLLKKRKRSRIFQRKSVKTILQEVLNTDWRLTADFTGVLGTFPPRNYCVQYRESDFDFVCRLMEEEGIWYYFRYQKDNQGTYSHQMILANTPAGHPAAPIAVTYQSESNSGWVSGWVKSQEIIPTGVSLWDYSFEFPDHLINDTTAATTDSLTAGTVTHTAYHEPDLDGNDRLVATDYPGGYAKRFDSIDPGGGETGTVSWNDIKDDGQRATTIRMEQEAIAGLVISGSSNCWYLIAGSKLGLSGHANADGNYVLTRVEHNARLPHIEDNSSAEPSFETGQATSMDARVVCANTFECIPAAVPYRPQPVTPRPRIEGTQTAIVTGTDTSLDPDKEVFVENKYFRVKVQFHWDPARPNNADSSCWVRVAQVWAGNGWGAFFWPRKGHEVVVAFEEGDPDRPIIIGSVYNGVNLPPAFEDIEIASHRTRAGIRSLTLDPDSSRYNNLYFNDEAGNESLDTGANMPEETPELGAWIVEQPMTVTTGYGFTVNPRFGAHIDPILPYYSMPIFGDNLSICVNPLGLLSELPLFSAAVESTGMTRVLQALQLLAPLTGGTTTFNVCSNTSLQYGPVISILHGNAIEITGNLVKGNRLASSLAALAATLFTVEMALASAYPNDTLKSGIVFDGIFGVINAILLPAIVGVELMNYRADLVKDLTTLGTALTTLGTAFVDAGVDATVLEPIINLTRAGTAVAAAKKAAELEASHKTLMVEGMYILNGKQGVVIDAQGDPTSAPFILINAEGDPASLPEPNGELFLRGSSSASLISGGLVSIDYKKTQLKSNITIDTCGAGGDIKIQTKLGDIIVHSSQKVELSFGLKLPGHREVISNVVLDATGIKLEAIKGTKGAISKIEMTPMGISLGVGAPGKPITKLEMTPQGLKAEALLIDLGGTVKTTLKNLITELQTQISKETSTVQNRE